METQAKQGLHSLLDELIDQLDTLISFLALSREDAFQLLNEHRLAWFADNEDALPAAYATYRRQVNHSAFLLGYSYFESFLTDLLAAILRSRPAMLPKKKQIEYTEILACPDKPSLMNRLIQKEIHELLYKKMSEIVDELRTKYQLDVQDHEEEDLIRASLLRNCIMHNSSHADARLAEHDGYCKGEEFELSSNEVHHFGITLRSLARRMCDEAQAKHG